MKIALLVNEQTPDVKTVVQLLSGEGYTILRTLIPDEIDQVGKQSRRVVLIFDDAKFAYKFCMDNDFGLDFDILKILFLPRKPIMNADVAQKLASINLELFVAGEEKIVRDRILSFEKPTDDIMDLQFSIIDDLEKEK